MINDRLLKSALILLYITAGYNLLESIIAVISGITAGSVALIGFGFDSLIELSAGILVIKQIKKGSFNEESTSRWVGWTLILLAIYITGYAFYQFFGGKPPEESAVGLILAIFSLIFMPVLGLRKRRIAVLIGSKALKAESTETIVCAWLSFTLLLGLGLNIWKGWWWADPSAALLMVPFLIREAKEALK
ncbi:cation transporter [bacterium]|nr:cation transporter [bacterium]